MSQQMRYHTAISDLYRKYSRGTVARKAFKTNAPHFQSTAISNATLVRLIGLSFFKHKTLLDGCLKPHDCKIRRFQQKICGFWMESRSKPHKNCRIRGYWLKSADFGQILWFLGGFQVRICKKYKICGFLAKIHIFCRFCVVFEFKTRKLLISSQSRERIQGGNINSFLESAKTQNIFGQNFAVLGQILQFLGGFKVRIHISHSTFKRTTSKHTKNLRISLSNEKPLA